MFARFGRAIVLNPWKVIAVWLVLLVGSFFAPSLADQVSTDQASFLPSRYESVQAQEVAERAFGQGDGASATIVVKRADGNPLGAADTERVGQLAQTLQGAGIDRVGAAVTGPQAVSPNKLVQLVNVSLTGPPADPVLGDAVVSIRDKAKSTLEGSGLSYAVTGDVALLVDNQDAFDTALLVVSIVTLALVVGLLLIIYRSPVAAFLPVVVVGVVSAVSSAVITLFVKAFGMQVDQSLLTILTVVLYGVGTDYIVFLLFRYRERLRAGDDPKNALATAVSRVGEVIASAAAAIVIAFGALLLAVFGGFRSLGPGLAIGVVVMAIAAVTLVPAIVSLIGPKVFWPSKSWQRTPRGSVFQRLGRFTGRRPAVVALASGGVMVALALGVFGLKVDYDQVAQLPANTESARALDDLKTGFPAGALNPTTVFVRADNGQRLDPATLTGYAQSLAQVPGVGSLMPAADGSPAAISSDGTVAQISLLLNTSPYSTAALDLAGDDLRQVAHDQAPAGTTALVGGVSSVFADIRDANNRDLWVIFPVAGVLIAVILGLLLRSLVAPVYLMIAVGLGFMATLGATVLAFQGIGGRSGLSFSLPIILYLFVVAIGTDYNILMIARLREEARAGNDPRTAASLAIQHAGPSVAAAGLILAGTFTSMLFAGVSFLTEMGFAVSVGIVLSAFIMSLFLVPGVTAILGHTAWWPGHGDATRSDRSEPTTAGHTESEATPAH
ncbi:MULTISPECIES: MMPL family transporter [Micromonospora]|uniref:RND superfamily putative drug exporter n=1 Tax=Micromonospora vinacea TaxID=709878 RepID=A0ABS0KAV3_9ACTN|nr:MMPL family transporter [Micromonospora vinacea]MBG6105767.1 RND superfamily putative drug exporter [Micromonospora vinacea]WSZ78079.1 MMPL family transporter [Micromonospora sp. NBC_00860]